MYSFSLLVAAVALTAQTLMAQPFPGHGPGTNPGYGPGTTPTTGPGTSPQPSPMQAIVEYGPYYKSSPYGVSAQCPQGYALNGLVLVRPQRFTPTDLYTTSESFNIICVRLPELIQHPTIDMNLVKKDKVSPETSSQQAPAGSYLSGISYVNTAIPALAYEESFSLKQTKIPVLKVSKQCRTDRYDRQLQLITRARCAANEVVTQVAYEHEFGKNSVEQEKVHLTCCPVTVE